MTRKTIKFHLVKKTSLLSFQMPSEYLKHHSEVKTSGNCSDIKSRTDDRFVGENKIQGYSPGDTRFHANIHRK